VQQSRRALRFDLSAPSSQQHPNIFWLVECLSVFKEGVNLDIDDCIPVEKPSFNTLKTLLAQHVPFITEDAQCLAIAQVLEQALEASQTLLPRNALDKEAVNEKEQEREMQQEQEVLRDPRAARNEEAHASWPVSTLRSTEALAPVGDASSRTISSQFARNTSTGGLAHPFYPLASLALDGRPLPLSFPRYMLMSHNYFRQTWALHQREHRRLKNIYVVLEWCPPRAVISMPDTGASTAEGTQWLPAGVPTLLQADRWTRAFQLLDVDRDGKLTGTELDSVSSSATHLACLATGYY